ncbi:MAG TPA: DUF2059 domain-containing protein [Candidatus Angelobacter sp.]
MRRVLIFFWLVIVAGLAGIGQQSKPAVASPAAQALPVDAPSREQVLKVLVHPDEVRQKLESVLGLLKQQVRQNIQQEGQASPDDLKFFDDLFDTAIKNISIEELLNAIVAVYQRHFTAADIDALAAFQATPAGIKLRTGQQELMARMMQVMDPKQGKLLAAQPLPADAPSKEQVLKLFEAAHVRQIISVMIHTFTEQSKAIAAETIESHGMDSREAVKSIGENDNDQALEHAVEASVMVYQSYYTAAEVESMTNFYLSAAGQKFMAAAPEIVAESAKTMVPMQRKLMESVFQNLAAREQKLKSQ